MDKKGLMPGDLPVLPSATINTNNLSSYNNSVLGEVLTLVDASMPQSDQRKALKSLIKQVFWRNYDVVWSWMNQQTQGNASSFPYASDYVPSSLRGVVEEV